MEKGLSFRDQIEEEKKGYRRVGDEAEVEEEALFVWVEAEEADECVE